ncbi:DUF2509 family protein [Lelliottia sp. CFBP8978]|uniref:DUF2509 family protein n=1 Tax=Lelliottia sp. CFBP8978 TaxID=3096522 RepID=UPI002A6B24C0|nr:DUF2509 family protein [Lelliottia sp. CFBP8978]MDY1037296.1 DUF2509 family protein [Lelliottia sp. CFBP8978]
MKRQKGMSSLALVLLLLVIGGLILTGLNQQLDSFTRIVSRERQSVQQRATVQSALEWGKRQLWSVVTNIQCKKVSQGRVCLRLLAEDRVLLIAGNGDMLLWRRGEIQEGRIVFSPHGWSDFCPLKQGDLCQLP